MKKLLLFFLRVICRILLIPLILFVSWRAIDYSRKQHIITLFVDNTSEFESIQQYADNYIENLTKSVYIFLPKYLNGYYEIPINEAMSNFSIDYASYHDGNIYLYFEVYDFLPSVSQGIIYLTNMNEIPRWTKYEPIVDNWYFFYDTY